VCQFAAGRPDALLLRLAGLPETLARRFGCGRLLSNMWLHRQAVLGHAARPKLSIQPEPRAEGVVFS